MRTLPTDKPGLIRALKAEWATTEQWQKSYGAQQESFLAVHRENRVPRTHNQGPEGMLAVSEAGRAEERAAQAILEARCAALEQATLVAEKQRLEVEKDAPEQQLTIAAEGRPKRDPPAACARERKTRRWPMRRSSPAPGGRCLPLGGGTSRRSGWRTTWRAARSV